MNSDMTNNPDLEIKLKYCSTRNTERMAENVERGPQHP